MFVKRLNKDIIEKRIERIEDLKNQIFKTNFKFNLVKTITNNINDHYYNDHYKIWDWAFKNKSGNIKEKSSL